MGKRLEELAEVIWRKGVASVDPSTLVQNFFLKNPAFLYRLKSFRKIIVVGGGKASAGLAHGLEQSLASLGIEWVGEVNVPQGNYFPLKSIALNQVRPLGINEVTEKAVEKTQAMVSRVKWAKPGEAVICLLSGGGSALLAAPPEGVSLKDKKLVTNLLSRHGAAIEELNCVRKHLSDFKGGKLAQAFGESAACDGFFLSLILSDVVGDPLDVIASGPTVPDPSTYLDAIGVLKSFHLDGVVPTSIIKRLEKGTAGEISETPKILIENVETVVIGNNAKALFASTIEASVLGFDVINLGPGLTGSTKDAALLQWTALASAKKFRINSNRPLCVLSGGETAVNLGLNPGKGGRNQEMALEMLLLMDKGGGNCTFLSGGTDGEDGPTDAAGAFASPTILTNARELGLKPEEYLKRHDSYNFFSKAGSLFKPGPTGTNVMDLRILLSE